MKYKKRLLVCLLVFSCMLLTGCTKLYEMTEEEENQVVLYSAKIVSKYNRRQDVGYSYVSDAKKEKKSGNTTTTEDETASATEDQQTVEPQITLTEAIGVDGISFEYTGYELSKTIATSDVSIPDASDGKTYVLLHVTISNTSQEAKLVDLINNRITYQLAINDTEAVDGLTTLASIDLSSYYNKALEAGNTADTVLMFEVNETDAAAISKLVLTVTGTAGINDIDLTNLA